MHKQQSNLAKSLSVLYEALANEKQKISQKNRMFEPLAFSL
jgi:hypothetical protein